MKRVAIVQSSYIPWKGYFDLIRGVDEFIFYDDAQLTKRDWRNRNVIKTPQGPQWLTIPIRSKGLYLQKISECTVSSASWGQSHWKAIQANYARAPYFERYAEDIQKIYKATENEPFLSRINLLFTRMICSILGVTTALRFSSDYPSAGVGKTEKLVRLCRLANATSYLSGPAAKFYLDENQFREFGIELRYADYEGYVPYRQLFGPFIHEVSILDLLFNEGPNAERFMKVFHS